MRKINYIVVHCSATREGCVLTPQALEADEGVSVLRGSAGIITENKNTNH